jgi:pyruvate formate lyase activating enzyme
MKGLIFNIKRYAIHDGPGIRVTFFLKGCTLDCWWCHNPEGIATGQKTVERIDRVGEREFRSSELVGHEYTAAEIVTRSERDRVFMEQSGGGVTFSGGEPLMQHAFLLEALIKLKEAGFHTVVDTSGHAPAGKLKSIIPYTDLFLYDIKLLDPEKHLRYTGVSNDLILSNFDMLLDAGVDVIVRVPVIPGVTAEREFIEGLRDFIEKRKSERIREISLLPYHKTGSSKYRRFNIPDRMEGIPHISNRELDEYIEILQPLGIAVKKGG